MTVLASCETPTWLTAKTLSVVIVSYRCRELLRGCLHSLRVESNLVGLEVIVVDNASADGTLEMLAADFPWVHAIDAGGNTGFAHATNLGLRRATGDLLLLLNPDTVVSPGALRACLDALEERPHVGMLSCRLLQPDGSIDHACKRSVPTATSAIAHFLRLSPLLARFGGRTYTAEHVDPDSEGYVDAVNGAFMLVRRQAVEAVGPLDEAFWMYAEDLDWCHRFWQAGWPVTYWPGAQVTHVKGGCSGRRRSPRVTVAFHRSMWLFYRKHNAGNGAAGRLLDVVVWCGVHLRLATSVAISMVTRSGS